MSLLFADGCDHYGVKSDIEGKYDVVDGSTQIAPVNTGGKFGGGYIGISADDTAIRKNITAATTSFFQGYFFFGGADTFGTDLLIVTYDSSIGAQCWLRVVDSGGTIEVRTTAGVIGTSTETLTKGQWLFFQLKMVISNTVGEVNFTVDGVNFLNLTNVDTQSTGNANVGRYAFYCPGTSSIDCRWDDIVLMDDAETENNALFDAHRIQTLYPDADGLQNDFTAVGAGTTNADRVDDGDTGPDGDTTYVETSTLDDKDLWEFDNLDSSDVGAIKSLQLVNYIRKDGAGVVTARNIIRQSPSPTIFEADDFVPSSSYTAKVNPTPLSTATLLPWTISEVNNDVEFGVMLAVDDAPTTIRATQGSMEVVYIIAPPSTAVSRHTQTNVEVLHVLIPTVNTVPPQVTYTTLNVDLLIAGPQIMTTPQQFIYNGVGADIQVKQIFLPTSFFMGF